MKETTFSSLLNRREFIQRSAAATGAAILVYRFIKVVTHEILRNRTFSSDG